MFICFMKRSFHLAASTSKNNVIIDRSDNLLFVLLCSKRIGPQRPVIRFVYVS